MESEPKTQIASILEPERAESPVSLLYAPRRVIVYRLLEMELERLNSSQNSLMFGFFGIAFGASLATGTTLSTVSIPNAHTYAAYWAAFLVSTFLAVVFLTFGVRDLMRSKREVERIKQTRTSAVPDLSILYSTINETKEAGPPVKG